MKQYLVVATEQIHVLHLSSLGIEPKANVIQAHRLPINGLKYSHSFGLLITACEESVSFISQYILYICIQVAKIWNVRTGECVFEFASLHKNHPITAIDVDQSGRRYYRYI